MKGLVRINCLIVVPVIYLLAQQTSTIKAQPKQTGGLKVRSETLVSTDWLAKHINDRDVFVIHVAADRERYMEFKEEYRNRAGIEGTISQGVRAFGLRRSRSMGISKTRLQHLATAAAISLERVSDWLVGIGREQTRRSAFARVMQPLTA
jgi:transposase